MGKYGNQLLVDIDGQPGAARLLKVVFPTSFALSMQLFVVIVMSRKGGGVALLALKSLSPNL